MCSYVDMAIASQYITERAVTRASAALELNQFSYRPGQRWQVEVSLPVVFQTSSVADVFDFAVISTQPRDVLIEVTRKSSNAKIRLVLDEQRRVRVISGLNANAGLDLFPLNLPRLDPPEGKIIVRSDAVEFETQDHFARPLKVIWKKRTPWPSYIQSSAGVAVLRKGFSGDFE